MGSIAGNVRTAVSWGIIVVMFWIAVMLAERQGVVFHSIIRPENYSMAMLMSLTGISCAVVAIMVSYVEMNRALRDDLQVTNAELEHLSFHDKLTGLPNRRFYDERFTTVLQRSAQHDTRTGLLFIDINKFKQINDTYGHALGDKILIAVSQRLQRALRESDLIARLGGDEFVAVLEEVHSADELTGIALKLTQAIDQPVTFRQHSIDVRTSIGIAMFPQDGRQKHELEEQADRAMYYAKKRGIPYALSGLEARNSPYPTKYRQDV
ncbi:MAG: GGDEF domain-containing protein, partial [Halioglobus sp.]|nr:GGDEF domain-containing protein [Halioglobus sp.]